MKDWLECQSCWADFRVVSDTDSAVAYCPYCGDEIVNDDDEEEDEFDD